MRRLYPKWLRDRAENKKKKSDLMTRYEEPITDAEREHAHIILDILRTHFQDRMFTPRQALEVLGAVGDDESRAFLLEVCLPVAIQTRRIEWLESRGAPIALESQWRVTC